MPIKLNYDPSLSGFIQADSIVPGAGNPLAWDRYAYTLNNPVRYTDPSGHSPRCGPDGIWCSNDFEVAHRISFGGTWSEKNKAKVRVAVELVAGRLAFEMGLDNSAMAFSLIYRAVHFQWGNCDACNGSGGFAYGYQSRERHHLIAFESITAMSSSHSNAFMRGVKNVVHELGHIYNNILGRRPSGDLDREKSTLRDNRDLFLRPNLDSIGNPCPLCLDWQQHPPEYSTNGRGGSETFADMFVAWTFIAWNTSPYIQNVLAVNQAQTWMRRWMP
ncbi:MAG: hypothetical protein KGZ53_06660 [Peptococcaceae bacterium]|nr:hypothetical protein [Peptococcaceae bacterium]